MKALTPDSSEIQIQAFCYQALFNCFPETRYSFFSVPNGGTRDVREMQQLKASGLLAGVADTIFLWDSRGYAFEFKDEKGIQRPDQIKFQEQCQRQNIPYFIVRTASEFWEQILPIIQPEIQDAELAESIEMLSTNPLEYAKLKRANEPLRKATIIA